MVILVLESEILQEGVTSSNPDEIYDFSSQFAFFSSVSNIIFYLKKRKKQTFLKSRSKFYKVLRYKYYVIVISAKQILGLTLV